MIRTTVTGALAGLATGVFGLITVCLACITIAFSTRGDTRVPGIIQAEFVTLDDAQHLAFLPDWSGMALALLVWVALAALLGALTRRGARPREEVHSGLADG